MTPARSAAYLEVHSALDWPLLACGLLVPATAEIAGLVLGVVLRQPWFFVIMGWLVVPIMIWTSLLYRNWPTGIRFDESDLCGRQRPPRPWTRDHGPEAA